MPLKEKRFYFILHFWNEVTLLVQKAKDGELIAIEMFNANLDLMVVTIVWFITHNLDHLEAFAYGIHLLALTD